MHFCDITDVLGAAADPGFAKGWRTIPWRARGARAWGLGAETLVGD